MGMDIDTAGQDQQAGGVDPFASGCRETGQVALDRHDPAAIDRDVGQSAARRIDHGPARDQ